MIQDSVFTMTNNERLHSYQSLLHYYQFLESLEYVVIYFVHIETIFFIAPNIFRPCW